MPLEGGYELKIWNSLRLMDLTILKLLMLTPGFYDVFWCLNCNLHLPASVYATLYVPWRRAENVSEVPCLHSKVEQQNIKSTELTSSTFRSSTFTNPRHN